jgi:hypothetical protein
LVVARAAGAQQEQAQAAQPDALSCWRTRVGLA